MKIKFVFLMLAALVTGCSSLKIDRHELAWQTMNMVDMAQTVQIARHPECYSEGDALSRQVMGRKPSEDSVYAWSIGGGLLHYGLSRLADKYKHKFGKAYKPLKWVDFTLKFGAVAYNHDSRLRVNGLTNAGDAHCEWAAEQLRFN